MRKLTAMMRKNPAPWRKPFRYLYGILYGMLTLGLLGLGGIDAQLTVEAAPPAAPAAAAPAPVAGSKALTLTMADLGDPDGYTLKTVKTERRYNFTRPTNWNVLPSSHVKVVFQHSPNLLPERSSLNVLVNNRILRTIPLGKDTVTTTTLHIPIPANLLKDRNTLAFQVDQHYTYKCEDPFSDELWTTLLEDTQLRLDYTLAPSRPNLALFPYPLYDPLGYGATQVTYVAPADRLSDNSLSALGVVATRLGQYVSWRPLTTSVEDVSALRTDHNLVLVGTPTENPAIAQLTESLPIPLQGGQFIDQASRTPYPEKTGILQFIQHPFHPAKTILIISGNSPAGVEAAGRLLVQNPTNRLLVGQSTVVDEFNVGPRHPYRAWEGFLQLSGSSFYDLGLETLTSRGITGLPLYYSLKRLPDLHFPGGTKVKLKTVYSYSSQLDMTQSKLEILLNGKALKSVPLNDKNGKSLADVTLEIPAEEFHTFNDLEYKFHLYPEKYDLCNFVTDVHIWGTIHNSSVIDVPGEIKTALPDLGLINDGGFPFTGYQDLTEVAVVVPERLTLTELNTAIQILSRLGRESMSKAGINLEVFHANSLPDAVRNNYHLIVVGTDNDSGLFKEIESKLALVLQGNRETLNRDNKALATLDYRSDQGILEQLISPWNNQRVVMLAYGATETGLKRLARLFEDDRLFARIDPGNILVINQEGPKSLTALDKGQARFFLLNELDYAGGLPMWIYIVAGILSFLGLLSILRFLFGR